MIIKDDLFLHARSNYFVKKLLPVVSAEYFCYVAALIELCRINLNKGTTLALLALVSIEGSLWSSDI